MRSWLVTVSALAVGFAAFTLRTPAQFSGGGSSLSFAPPYTVLNGTSYVTMTGQAATKPSVGAWSVLGSNTMTIATQTNGDVTFANSANAASYYGGTASAAIQAEFTIAPASSSSSGNVGYINAGIWLWDSTNNKVYILAVLVATGENAAWIATPLLESGSYSGSGSVGSTSNLAFGGSLISPVVDFKLSVSGGTLTPSVSVNGGTAYFNLPTQSVGTISKGGVMTVNTSSMTTVMDVLSLVVN